MVDFVEPPPLQKAVAILQSLEENMALNLSIIITLDKSLYNDPSNC